MFEKSEEKNKNHSCLMIPVLFTQKNSNYNKIQIIDCYDEKRDALSFNARIPLIAHPPCRKFSKLRGLSTAPTKEKQLAFFALAQVRMFGGILEHPRSSTLWKEGNFNLDGSVDSYGGFLRSVDLSWFGFPARKKTMLYFCGIAPGQLPPFPISFNAITHVISNSYKSDKKEIPRNMRSTTPFPMIEFFIEVMNIINENRAQ